MEITIKVKEEKVYKSLLAFFKSIGIVIVSQKDETSTKNNKKSAESFVNKWGGIIKNVESQNDSKLDYLLKKHK